MTIYINKGGRPKKWIVGAQIETYKIVKAVSVNGKPTFTLSCIDCGHTKTVSHGTLRNGYSMTCSCTKQEDKPVMPSPLMKADNYTDGVTVNTAKGTIIVYKGSWFFVEELNHFLSELNK